MVENINTKNVRLEHAIEEVKKVKICSKKYLNEKYGWNTVKLLKTRDELGFTGSMVYHITSLFKEPKSIKELSNLFDVKRDTIQFILLNLINEGILDYYHINGIEKYYFLKKVKPDIESLYRSTTKNEILSLLKIVPIQVKEMIEILNINKFTLLSALGKLRKKGIVNTFNSAGGTNNKYYWYLNKNELHAKLSCILALKTEKLIKLLDEKPNRISSLSEELHLSIRTLQHKLKRLMDAGIVKRFKNGRYFVYYLIEDQLIQAKIESLSNRQRFIYDQLINNSYSVLELRDLCGFKNDEGYRVRNAIKTLLKFNLVKCIKDEIYTVIHFEIKKEKTIYNDILEYFEKITNFKIYCSDETTVSTFYELFNVKPIDINNKKMLECLILSRISIDSMIVYNFIINYHLKYISELEFTDHLYEGLVFLVSNDVLDYFYVDEIRYYFLHHKYEIYFKNWFKNIKKYYRAIINSYRKEYNYSKIPFMEVVLHKIIELELFYNN